MHVFTIMKEFIGLIYGESVDRKCLQVFVLSEIDFGIMLDLFAGRHGVISFWIAQCFFLHRLPNQCAVVIVNAGIFLCLTSVCVCIQS